MYGQVFAQRLVLLGTTLDGRLVIGEASSYVPIWWRFEGLNGSSILRSAQLGHASMVMDLWIQNIYKWNMERVRDLYGEEMARMICELPLLQHGPEDRIIWFHDSRGTYTTKSRYSWLVLKKVGFGPHRLF